MDTHTEIVLMNRERVGRSLQRIAHEIAEQNIKNIPVLLFGINERGYVVANILADILNPMFEEKAQVIQLPVKKDMDEQPFKKLNPESAKESFLIVVDDVIFSGRTMFTALKKITDHWNPSEIHTATLIDRGHRKFPIQAEYCGMSLPTKRYEHVHVIVEEEKIEEVILKRA